MENHSAGLTKLAADSFILSLWSLVACFSHIWDELEPAGVCSSSDISGISWVSRARGQITARVGPAWVGSQLRRLAFLPAAKVQSRVV